MAIVLAVLLPLDATHLAAQEPGAKLNIVIVEGEGAINNIRQRTAREPIVQVEDENRRPVGGAVVTFLLPDSGASGSFTGGSKTLMVTTDERGRAIARGLRPNNTAGKFQIRVTASHQGLTGSASISQVNAIAAAAIGGGAAAGISAKVIALIVAAGAAAAVGTVAATRSDSPAQPASAPPVISAGTPSVGGPR